MSEQALQEFCDLVGSEGAVAVRGSGTRFDLGGELSAGTRIVQAPTGIVKHLPEEMTVQVRAGTSVEELHQALATKGQRTALPERGGTVGGALAAGENDLHVLGRGRVRDAVLQVRYVSAEGRLITGGGPTVKNVTGFDLPRLMVGSLGTLGLIAEVILRTNPIPPASIWLCSRNVHPFAAFAAVTQPSVLLWDGSSTWIQLEGHLADLGSQRQSLSSLGPWFEVDGPPDLPAQRWSLTPQQLREPTMLSSAGPFVASIGVGTVFATERRAQHPPTPSLQALTMSVKDSFDPTGRLSPGRDVLRGTT